MISTERSRHLRVESRPFPCCCYEVTGALQAADSSKNAVRLTIELSGVKSEKEELKRNVVTARAERDDLANLADR